MFLKERKGKWPCDILCYNLCVFVDFSEWKELQRNTIGKLIAKNLGDMYVHKPFSVD